MTVFVALLILFPVLGGLGVSFLPKRLGTVAAWGTVVLSAAAAVGLCVVTGAEPVFFSPGHLWHPILLGADWLLLGYFLYRGVRHRSLLVFGFALAQIFLFGFFLSQLGEMPSGAELRVDLLAGVMLLLINIVGGTICLYGPAYIADEDTSERKKASFMGLLLAFLGVMNFAVLANNLEWFFLAFEATTLFSYLLIRFRADAESQRNAVRALWMNQVGGVAILLALISLLDVGSFDFHSVVVVGAIGPVIFLSLAALVKGAHVPFDRWLLGAMVAPTPVSAILHSSTMVKLAPYMLLRLGPALAGTWVSGLLVLLGAFVVFAAGIRSLAERNLKRILAQSTICMLGLMTILAAMGSGEAAVAALCVIVFHGVSKALLFLLAGVVEREFHAKRLEDFRDLAEHSPWLSFAFTFGFMSMTLPPFGLFFGKWFAVGMLGGEVSLRPEAWLAVIFVAIGLSAVTTLYLKMLAVTMTRRGTEDRFAGRHLRATWRYAPGTLILLLFLAVLFFVPLNNALFLPAANALGLSFQGGAKQFSELAFAQMNIPLWFLLALFLLLPLIVFTSFYVRFRADRAREYTCGERLEIPLSSYVLSFPDEGRVRGLIDLFGGVLFVSLLGLGLRWL